MARNLNGSFKFRGKDDETGKDEFLNVGPLEINKDLNEGEIKNIVKGIWKWGGECRLEMRIDAQYVPGGGGLISVFGDALLFEGTSEDTDNLRVNRRIEFIVQRTTSANPNPTTHFEALNASAGDYAHINFTLSNRIIESE